MEIHAFAEGIWRKVELWYNLEKTLIVSASFQAIQKTQVYRFSDKASYNYFISYLPSFMILFSSDGMIERSGICIKFTIILPSSISWESVPERKNVSILLQICLWLVI